jgi:iron complex transport system substrate-binding protein
MLSAFAIAACQGKADRSMIDSTAPSSSELTDCQTIQHQMGETEVCGQPQKIVVLGSSVLEPLLALDVQPAAYADYMLLPTGNDDTSSQPLPYLESRITGQLTNVGLATSPSIEAILKVQPDLIIGTEYNVSQYETLSKIAPTLLLEWNDAEKNLKTIARTVGRSEKAEQLLTETERQIAMARGAFAPIVATHPKVLLLRSGELQDIYVGNRAFGRCSSLIQDLGFQLISPPELDQFERENPASISLETLPQLNDADLIILLGSNFRQPEHLNSTGAFEKHQLSDLKQAWEVNAIAQSLDASQAGRVYFIPAYMCLGLPGSIGTELYLEELQEQLLSSDSTLTSTDSAVIEK